MAVFNEPAQWDHTLGNNADTSTLPDDAAATAGIASLQKLFQIINATPLEAGGIAPDREDVNALFKYLGDQIFYTQNGGVPSYNAAYDYIPGRVVLYTDNNLYKCVQANGASSTVVAPGTDEAYWQQLDKPSSALLPNQLVISPVPMTDANLHLLDGALLSGSGAYADYVAMMGELYTADPTATCWTDEATWQSSVTTYGECGKFVYDSVNNTLRLPKLGSFVQATTTASELGTLVEAGAPNITGSTQLGFNLSDSCYSVSPSGAFVLPATVSGTTASSADTLISKPYGIRLDASQSNSIYGNSNTIQPQAIKYYFYIVVGTISKTDIQIDIDNVMADLALKADKDFSNVSAPVQAFKDMSIGWGMPDYSAGITVSAIPYTAPSDGYFTFMCVDVGTTLVSVYVNGVAIFYFIDAASGANGQSGNIQVQKNDVITSSASIGAFDNVVFYPCKGAN